MDAAKYVELIKLKAVEDAQLYQKIRNDTFRTFTKDKEFQERVPEETLIRVINAFCHYMQSKPNTRSIGDFNGNTCGVAIEISNTISNTISNWILTLCRRISRGGNNLCSRDERNCCHFLVSLSYYNDFKGDHMQDT
jgi:hypothetical protein